MKNINFELEGGGSPAVAAVNVYSKITFNGVEYSLPAPYQGFALARGVAFDGTSKLGFVTANNEVVYNGYYYALGMIAGYSEQSASNYNSSYPVISPSDETLQDALGTTEAFELVYES